jgi:predicted Zn-dependent protease
MQEVASGEEDAEAPDIYAKGSYANNTNVRRDSDVDIVVENREDPLSGLPGPGKSGTARRRRS